MFSSELCLHFLEWTRQAEKTAWFSLVPPYLQSLFCRAANFMSVPRLNPAQFLQQRTHESFFPDLATTKDKIREDLFRTARQQSHVGVGMKFSTQSQNATSTTAFTITSKLSCAMVFNSTRDIFSVRRCMDMLGMRTYDGGLLNRGDLLKLSGDYSRLGTFRFPGAGRVETKHFLSPGALTCQRYSRQCPQPKAA